MSNLSTQLSTEEQQEIHSIISQADSIFFDQCDQSVVNQDDKENNQSDQSIVNSDDKEYHQNEKVVVNHEDKENDPLDSPPSKVPSKDMDDSSKSSTDFKDLLRVHFGHRTFRPLQLKIIETLVYDRRDVLAVMATGFGKSLCFQFPAIIQNGIGLVISPLIALMQDQVLNLKSVQIPACLLGQGAETGITQNDILSGPYKICYLTPEYATNNLEFVDLLHKRKGISLVAVDEVHCVSQWGHDFRPSYRNVGLLKQNLTDVPFIGVTATATASVREDIVKSLHLSNPLQLISGFNRTNLFLGAKRRLSNYKDINTFDFGKTSTIIYCPTKKSTEKLAAHLNAIGRKSVVYHAGMSPEKRKLSHVQFMSDTVQVMVATVAFGMGIDKPDIENILHYGAPKDIESYYQEIGRGGRDGRSCKCLVFYSDQDFAINRALISNIENVKYSRRRLEMLKTMDKYLRSRTCRRRQLIDHFSKTEQFDCIPANQCCDNCISNQQNAILIDDFDNHPSSSKKELSFEAKLILSSIEDLGGRFGANMYIRYVRGSTSSKMTTSMKSKKNYGRGRSRSDKFWKSLIGNLIDDNFIEEFSFERAFSSGLLRVSSKGKEWLAAGTEQTQKLYYSSIDEIADLTHPHDQPKRIKQHTLSPVVSKPEKIEITLLPSTKVIDKPWIGNKSKVCDASDASNSHLEGLLYTKLFNYRNELSLKSGIAAHRVVTNKALASMVKVLPRRIEDLKAVEEFPIAKALSVGHSLIDIINEFCKENSWPPTNRKEIVQELTKIESITETRVLDSSLPEHCKDSYIQFQIRKLTPETVAANKSLTVETIVRHISSAMQYQMPVDLNRLNVDEDMVDRIECLIRRNPINSDISKLKPIMEVLNDDSINYTQLRLVLDILKLKYGVTPIIEFQDETNKCGVDKKVKLPEWMSCSSPPAKLVSNVAKRKRKLVL